MELLYWFQSIRTPVMDSVMSIVTHLGEETFFMLAALIVFWCVDKRKGYYLLTVGFVGTLINQWLKIACRIPRPWVQDPNFSIVEAARAEATGYSFPSGHTQAAVGYLGGIARFTDRIWLRIVCIVLAVMTAISRMYLGVHTPLDVGVSIVIAVILVLVVYPLMESTLWFPNRMYAIIGGMLLFSLAYLAYVELYPFPVDVDAANLASAVKNAYTMTGAVSGVLVVYAVDNKFIHFSTRAPWWGQLIKLTVGLALAVAVKSLLKAPLLALCGGHDLGNLVRYFLLVVVAGAVWPWTFRFFERCAK